MTYGDIAYRLLVYNDENKVTQIISGNIDAGDTLEVTHELTYSAGRVSKIDIEDEWDLFYVYENDLLRETNEWLDGELFQKNKFEYDPQGHLKSWEALQKNDAGELATVTKTLYTFNNLNNVVQTKLYTYTEDTPEGVLVSTIDYSEFDAKKNSFSLFLGNLYHPYLKMFQNNPGKMTVTQGNGSQAVERYAYTYNTKGYVTKQESLSGGHPIEFTFEEF